MSEAPIAIHPSVIIDKYGRVEAIDAIHLVGVVSIPVAHLERSVRTVALGNQSVAESRLVVGEQIISLLSVLVCHQRHIGSVEHISGSCRVEGFALGILIYYEDFSVVAPLAQIFHRRRPYHLVASAVHCLQIVVRTIDIDALLTRIVRVFKHIRFSIGNMFPHGQIGITLGNRFLFHCFHLS